MAKPITHEEMTVYVEATWNKCQGEAWRREDITRMAREAGFVGFDGSNAMLRKFAALVATAEREACAKVCDGMDHNGVMIAADCAAAIRARSES